MKRFVEFVWNTKWALSLSAGILLGLSWPPFPFPFLVFPAFFLLFRLIDICDTAREAAYWAYPGLIVWNIITTYWMVMATVAGGIAAILANSAVMTVPIMLMYLFQKKLHSHWLIAITQTATWINYEYLHHLWDLAWPWLALGNAWANVPSLVQYISATGYLGISLWIVLVTALAYQATKTQSRKPVYASVVVLLIFPLISLVQFSSLNVETDGSLETVVAQPNYDTATYPDFGGYSDAYEALDVVLEISDSVRTDSTELVVWPESGIRTQIYSARVNDRAANEIKQLLKEKAAEWDLTLLSGVVYYEFFDLDNAPSLSRGTGSNPYLYYNAALGFYPDSTIEVYRKHNLVPVVERIPFIHFLDAIDVFDWVSFADIQAFGKGYEPTSFKADGVKTQALICYDSVFPSWVRRFVQDGAGFITIITNDGWWGNTSGHEQHFSYARLRAIEFRRWVVRSANNGISGIIDPSGSIKVETKYWTKTAFRYDVPIIYEQTLYSRFGDWLPYSMIVITGWGILLLLFRKFRPEKAISST
ncbi:apolipoprotein N-acyltransferase [Balneolaceae bacterium YR4-1]|uniref:Apolipoprotein N-acyltransferase n=1 Tax=Halalkalibaculum roseum TaxID=2709311 RepID=A0A6M1T4C1_9BACT|nr:apolipoprotein N-acyltransferase [Halalkalibaculum roseum]NGP76845.1 apolipoprotein N-acyltransferase [Halalkalibaculum roseum]